MEDACRPQADENHKHGLQHHNVEITALVNDTTGTLASAQYGDPKNNTDTCISIIVGTGEAHAFRFFVRQP